MSNKNVLILDYGMGNLASIQKMVEFVGGEATISSNIKVIEKAGKIIFPGVGAFDTGMKNLVSSELIPILRTKALEERIPILGICLGAQLLSRKSQEGMLPGLGWLAADTVRFKFDVFGINHKIPHMGWNTVNFKKTHPIFFDFDETPRFYFAHSYHLICDDVADVVATSCYGYEFPSIVQNDNLIGVQFHPEKSHRFGAHIFKQFIYKI